RSTKMLLRVGRVSEPSGGLYDNLCAHARPVNFSGVFDCKNLDFLAADTNAVAFGFNVFIKLAKNRIVLKKMRQRLGVCQIIGCNKFNLGVVQARADDISPDTAKAVDPYSNWHIPLF